MDKERWLKIEEIIDRVFRMENTENLETFIKDSCEDDNKLYQEVMHLMRSIEKAEEEGFLELK